MKIIPREKLYQKRYSIFEKLLQKQGFKISVQEERKKLGIPLEGFDLEVGFAGYVFKLLNANEKKDIAFNFYLNNESSPWDINNEKFSELNKAFGKSIKDYTGPIALITAICAILDNQHFPLKHNEILKNNKSLHKIFISIDYIINKFWSLDLIDQEFYCILTEKYLLFGEKGVDKLINSLIDCPCCKHFGIAYFSPTRIDMKNIEVGALGKDYLFNDQTVKKLSKYFDSTILLIKPYATKQDTVNFIEENWDFLQAISQEKNRFYDQVGIKYKKIKSSDIERNSLIFDLYQNSKNELLQKIPEDERAIFDKSYKEEIISKILANENRINISSDAIKKIASRFKSQTKIKLGDI